LIFEVTEGRILPLPIANQQSSISNRQFFPSSGKTAQSLWDSSVPSSRLREKNPPWGEFRAGCFYLAVAGAGRQSAASP
jgi:hypothetical protein